MMEPEYKPVTLLIGDVEWLEWAKRELEEMRQLAAIPPLTVTVHCHECNSTYETVFAPKITCPFCNTVNDCILEGTTTPEWLLRHP